MFDSSILDLDPTTQSNYFDIVTESVVFDWTVDFNEEIIKGNVIHHFKVKKDGVSQVM
jgi:leukotriene-A4 hydrolase